MQNAECRMKKARIRLWLSGWGSQRGDFGTCSGRGGYQMYHCDTFDMSLPWRRLWKLKGRQGRLRRMLLAGRALDWGRCARVLRTATSGDWGGSRLRQGPSVRPGIMPLAPLRATCFIFDQRW